MLNDDSQVAGAQLRHATRISSGPKDAASGSPCSTPLREAAIGGVVWSRPGTDMDPATETRTGPKLGARNRVGIAAWAWEHGIMTNT
jgi:hypothetical protein